MLIDTFIDSIKSHIDFTQVKTILDIGSRDLEQSKELHSVFPDAKIHAFEPNPESFRKCEANAPDYVKVWPYACLDYDGGTPFYSVSQKDNHGASSVFEPTDNVVGVDHVDGLKRILVPCKRIDTWARENHVSKIDLVWQDVQNAEIPCLVGFGRMLDDVKALATEAATGGLYYPNRNYQPTQYEQLKDFLEANRFVEVLYDQPWPFECDTAWVRKKLIK